MAKWIWQVALCGFLLAAPELSAAKIITSRSAVSSDLSRQKQMVNDLGFIQNLFEVTYAPLQWKQSHLGWDLDKEIAEAKNKVLGNPATTTKQFQGIVKEVCANVKDYHVVAEFYSTERATLPFSLQKAGDKYYISHIDISEFKQGKPPFSVGDEVVRFNNRPIHTVIEEFRRQEIGMNVPTTDLALAELYLTTRLGSLGHAVPDGSVDLVLRPSGSSDLQTLSLVWDYYPELISSAYLLQSLTPLRAKPPTAGSAYDTKHFVTPHYQALSAARRADHEPSVLLGAKKSMVPKLGDVLWEAPEEGNFHAYLFALPAGKQGGYVRISSYHADADEAAKEFAEIIHLFQQEADVLVIDQLNNPGGSILYLYALLSMLTDRPLDVPKHRVKITQSDVYLAVREIPTLKNVTNEQDALNHVGETIDGFPVNLEMAQGLLNVFCFLLDQWDSGKLFTDFHYLYGIEKIPPHPEANYTKPILVLINSMDFSGGDFFPAIMQDNQRAKLMGTRTAGAGGYIEKVSFPNLNGINELDLTASFCIRPNGLPIENLGVTPDIPYEVSAIDLQNNYIEYVHKILEELHRLLKN